MPKGMPLPPEPKRPMNFTPSMKPAPALAAWPPTPFRHAYQVGDKHGANWQTVAAGFGVPNVWDLIWFNFRTTDPREDFDQAVETDGKVQNPVLRLREAIRNSPHYITYWWKLYRNDGI